MTLHPLMGRRGLGWLPDAFEVVEGELVARHLSGLVGAFSPVAAPVLNYTSLLDKIPDQGPTSSCVGQAFATSLYLTAKLAGTPIPRPSAKAIYDFARAEDQPYVRLVDVGSRPLAAIRCLRDKGMVAEADWPLVIHPSGMSNIDARPPLDVFQSALGYKLGDHYRIPAGSGASAMVRHAIARGYCPVFAMPVDDAFSDWTGDAIYPGRKGVSRGGHMQAIAGYDEDALIVVGSWGTSFGDGGVVRIAADYFDSGECTDILVPTIVPALAAA